VPLLGQAAMLLSFDVATEAIVEHDAWHTHEHLPERLSIPGFLRGTRWASARARPRYFVLYEVEHLAVLTSQSYMDRLNNPSPWTTRIMPHYRGMTRGFCSVSGSFGVGTGQVGALVRFEPSSPSARSSLREWLLSERLPGLPDRQGIGSVHLFEASLQPTMTTEQRIRGADEGFGWALLLTGYSEEGLTQVLEPDLGKERLEAHGADRVSVAIYQFQYAVVRGEVHG
jgi:hypothetical protein